MTDLHGARRGQRRRPSLGLVLAVLALVASLGGTAYAAVAAKNSVVSSSIRNGEVKTRDLARDAVTSPKIRNGSVRAGDLATGSIGGRALADPVVVHDESAPVGDSDDVVNGGLHNVVSVTARCPGGTSLLTGGAAWTGASPAWLRNGNFYVQSAFAVDNAWVVRGVVDVGDAGTVRLRSTAVCLPNRGLLPVLNRSGGKQ